MLYFLQQALNGLHGGALYALLAFGYVLTNGVLRRTNLAYGAVFAFGGQTMILFAVFGWNVLWLSLPATVAFGVIVAFAYALLVGKFLSRSVLAPLAARSPNAIVTATLGIAIALMEIGRISAETRDFWLPPMLSDPVVFVADTRFRVTLTVVQLLNCAIVVLVIAAGAAVLARSRFGREWRAVSDDAAAAALSGVDTDRIFQRTVVGGALVATIAGVLMALYYGNVSFGTGLTYGLKVLFVTAVGGYHAPVRAAAGAALFGIAEAIWTGYFPVEWRDAAVFAALVALLVLRPESDARRETA